MHITLRCVVMRKIKTEAFQSSNLRKILAISICFLLIQDVVLSLIIEIEPTRRNFYGKFSVRSKHKKYYQVRRPQTRRVSNEFSSEEIEEASTTLLLRAANRPNMLTMTDDEEDDSESNEIQPEFVGRTSHYLYNITHDQGLDTIIYVPFLERILSGFNGKLYATVYPGTIWCGVGNHAQDESSVGYFSSTDRCCRDHDLCHDSIPAKTVKHGLRNPGFFTRSHCECDQRFYRCLKYDNSFVSRKIGAAYFNILRPQCFRREYPIMYCWIWLDGRCLNYVVDNTRMKEWQWFDNKPF